MIRPADLKTRGVRCNPEAVVLSNRSACFLKLELAKEASDASRNLAADSEPARLSRMPWLRPTRRSLSEFPAG